MTKVPEDRLKKKDLAIWKLKAHSRRLLVADKRVTKKSRSGEHSDKIENEPVS